MTNTNNPEEIEVLDSSKHGESPMAASSGNPDAIVAAISLMTRQLVSSITTLNSSMDHSFGEMKETLGNLVYEGEEQDEGSVNSDSEKEHDKAPNKDSATTTDKARQPASDNTSKSSQKSLENHNDKSKCQESSSKEENTTLAGIASSLKLGHKKAPPVNEQFAGILKEVMRVKLDDDVLLDTKNRYTRPENCQCLEPTQVNHLIWDKLKHETRSGDLKLQRIQANLLKGIIPIVSIVEKLVKVQDKIPVEVLDVEAVLKTATDSVAMLGAANFGLNMQRRDNIKPELNADYKHLCSPTVPFTEFLFGDDPDLSKQLKDLAEATKVSKKISKNHEPKQDYKGQNYNKSYKHSKGKRFGYKYSHNHHLNSRRPSFSANKQKEEGKKHK